MSGHGDLRKEASLRHSSYSQQPAISRFSDSQDGQGQKESSSQAASRLSDIQGSHSSSTRNGRDQRKTKDGTRLDPSTTTSPRRQRTSGGFLLGSTLRRRREREAETGNELQKGKGKVREQYGSSLDGADTTLDRQRASQDGLDASKQRFVEHEQDEFSTPHRADHSHASPRSSRHERDLRAESPALDPAQLIQMALSLSEGRRRYASAGLALPAQSADTRRIQSSGARMTNALPGSPLAIDKSADHFGPVDRPFDSSTGDVEGLVYPTSEDAFVPPDFHFSTSTLARADRARRFFELSAEYRRLLASLPPLKPDSTAPGNYTIATQSTPGSTFPHITRVRSNTTSKHALGRDYNPVQFLRNTRLRHRERRALEPSPASFEDTDEVRHYVDQVELNSNSPFYRSSPDIVNLPTRDDEGDDRRGSVVRYPSGHKRTDTVSSKVQWTNSDWSFTPMDLLADAVWTEKKSNKSLLEDRHGRRLFPDLSSSGSDSSPSIGHPNAPPPASRKRAGTASKDFATQVEAKDHKRRKFLPIHRPVSDGRKQRLSWKRGRSEDDFSDSGLSTDEKGPSSNNIGPLRRHMQDVIKNESDEQSPELASPDQWDDLPVDQHQPMLSIPDPFPPVPVVEVDSRKRSLRPKPLDLMRSRSYTEGVTGSYANGKPVHPVGDIDPDSPISPAIRTALPLIGMNLSPPKNKTSQKHISPDTEERDVQGTSRNRDRLRKTDSILPMQMIDAEHNDDRHNVRMSFESTRSTASQRHETASSEAAELRRVTDRARPDGQAKGHGRTMSRFLKGGRIGELVRGESSMLGDRFRRKDQASEIESVGHESDTESEDESPLTRTSTDLSTGDRPEKPRYHIPLPAFRPANETRISSGAADFADPIARQQSARKEQNLLSRLNRMPPPRLDVPTADDGAIAEHKSQPGTPTNAKKKLAEDNRRALLSPAKLYRSITSGSRASLVRPGPVKVADGTQLPSAESTKIVFKPGREPPSADRRHWSIADRGAPQALEKDNRQVISPRDIARVRALYLSSGIKAHELCRRADAANGTTPALLVSAAKKCGAQLDSPVPRKDEIAFAARLLSRSLNASIKGAESDIDAFRGTTMSTLRSRVEDLRQKAAEKLTLQVHETADDAETFITDLNTHQTLAVQQVNDAIGDMLRARRRRLRWLRRTGFTALEWLVLGVMWCVWFIVVIVNLVKGMVGGVFHVIRWLFMI